MIDQRYEMTPAQLKHWYTVRQRILRRPRWRVKLSQWCRRFLHRTGLDL